MEPLRPANMPPLSVGSGASKSKPPPVEKVQEESVFETTSPFLCTFGTRGATRHAFKLGSQRLKDEYGVVSTYYCL